MFFFFVCVKCEPKKKRKLNKNNGFFEWKCRCTTGTVRYIAKSKNQVELIVRKWNIISINKKQTLFELDEKEMCKQKSGKPNWMKCVRWYRHYGFAISSISSRFLYTHTHTHTFALCESFESLASNCRDYRVDAVNYFVELFFFILLCVLQFIVAMFAPAREFIFPGPFSFQIVCFFRF